MGTYHRKWRTISLSILFFLVSVFVVLSTFFIAIWRILLWKVLNPYLQINADRLIHLLNIPNAGFTVDIAAIMPFLSQVLIIAVILFLGAKNKAVRHREFWLMSIPLLAVLIITICSQFWSLDASVTVKRSWFFLATTMGGLFIGLEFRRPRIVWFFEILSILSVVLSYLIVFRYPNLGIMTRDTPGAWIGVFNYKSFAGQIIAFAGIMFLFRLADFRNEQWPIRIYSLLFLLLSLYFLYKTKNATALGSFIIAAGVLALGILFIKWGQLLKPIHWGAIGIIGVFFIIVLWFGKDTLFGLLGRSASLTGRTPLWMALIPFIKQKLYVGYGFGEVFWHSKYLAEFWKVAPWKAGLAHSGYVEAILDTGLVGFLFWFAFLVEVGFLTGWYFLKQRSLYSLISSSGSSMSF